MPVDPASYRDPAGHVFQVEDKIYRTILPKGLEHYSAVRQNGGLNALVS
ncbi:MAG: hypothetical protein HKN05_16840, partial [Rhizobiales bacterium]|nr:hypothetical protein [Hyphomicrobiales bacterium]